MSSPCRNKARIAAASSACPKSSAVRQLIMERWCGVLGVEQCWLLVAVFSELNGGSHKVANRNIAACMRRITSMSTVCPRRRQTQVNFFYVHPLRNKEWITAASSACPKLLLSDSLSWSASAAFMGLKSAGFLLQSFQS